MASKNNSVLNKSHAVRKTFSYSRGAVTMNMTLRIDTKEELNAGLDIGKEFVFDLEKELAKFKKQ